MLKPSHVIVGLGITGLSCAHFLKNAGIPFAILDSRQEPPNLNSFKENFREVPIVLGRLDSSLLDNAECIILSPGISLREPAIAKQVRHGKKVLGDIELFAQAAKAPVIAITGTNAKSTVTTLVGLMAKEAGCQVEVGGNLGVPALNLLNDANTELFVLELSSFQLETTYSLKAKVATVLNITPDHMDRYDTLDEYQNAKHRIYQQCQTAVCNRDDSRTELKNKTKHQNILHFTLQSPCMQEFGLLKHHQEMYLAFENELLLPVKELPLLGIHHQANALAALAIGHSMGFAFEPMLNVLRRFKGLAHRCQLVREINQVKWYNDSKGTNVGATQAAIEGIGKVISGKLIVILGGVGKNADFSPLVPILEKYSRHIILIGEAAQDIANVIHKRVQHSFANTMDDAILKAAKVACPNDSVLLSPACASFDMFRNYEHRGEVFSEIVQKL